MAADRPISMLVFLCGMTAVSRHERSCDSRGDDYDSTRYGSIGIPLRQPSRSGIFGSRRPPTGNMRDFSHAGIDRPAKIFCGLHMAADTQSVTMRLANDCGQ